ncbi:MAG: hypothetical protein AAGA68_20315 [Pseudomonadota bacterium]
MASSERLRWQALDTQRRDRLRSLMFQIFDRYHVGFDQVTFESSLLGSRNCIVHLLYATDRALVGFVACQFSIVSEATSRHGVFSAAVYIDTAFKGGSTAALCGLREALRVRCRYPSLPLAYLAIALSPAPYHLYATTMPRVYPSRRGHSGEPPQRVARVMRTALAARGWAHVGDDPWCISTPLRCRDASWVRRSRTLSESEEAQYYAARVPGWASAGHALAVWIPLDLSNILGAIWRLAATRLRRQ